MDELLDLPTLLVGESLLLHAAKHGGFMTVSDIFGHLGSEEQADPDIKFRLIQRLFRLESEGYVESSPPGEGVCLARQYRLVPSQLGALRQAAVQAILAESMVSV